MDFVPDVVVDVFLQPAELARLERISDALILAAEESESITSSYKRYCIVTHGRWEVETHNCRKSLER